jgi:hypothetical protein
LKRTTGQIRLSRCTLKVTAAEILPITGTFILANTGKEIFAEPIGSFVSFVLRGNGNLRVALKTRIAVSAQPGNGLKMRIFPRQAIDSALAVGPLSDEAWTQLLN